MDYGIKLKFSSYVHLPSINKMFQISLCLIDSLQRRRGYYFRAWVLYIPALEHVRKLILSRYVLLACINPIYKYGHAWVI